MILVCTTDTVAGHETVETLGLVRGSASRTRHIFADLVMRMRNAAGMELTDYIKMMAETREQALDRMKDHALQLGGNAVVGCQIETSTIAPGSFEVIAYGTAVRLAGRFEGRPVDLKDA